MLFHNIIGIINDTERSFSERVFVLLTIISEIALFIALVGDIISGENIVEIGILIFTIVAVPVIVAIGVKKNRIDISIKIIILTLVFLVLPSIFFFGGGLLGGGVLWFIFAFMYVGLVLNGTWRSVMISMLILGSGFCYLVDFLNPEIIAPHTRVMYYMDSYLSLILVGLVSYVMVLFQNRLFKRENTIAKKEAERAEELNRSQNRFFSSMSHEIRTPINSILGLNELILRQEDASEEIIKDANGIAGSGKMLLSLINDILDFSKIEAGGMHIVPVDYEVSELLSEIVNMIWPRAMEKGLKIDVSVDPDVPSVLYGDEVRIKQILINLLNNAVKYTKEGTVSLHIESERSGDGFLTLLISVSDTGMGIKSDSLPYLFDAFKRIDEEKNRYIEGTGLGLSIVKQLVDLMEGEITVNSVYGEGSTFNVSIKQAISDNTCIGELSLHNYGRTKQSVYESSFTAPDASILIVDDNELNLEVEKKLLTGTELRIDTAISGKEALNATLSHKYDVIFMDHLMPEMDGIACFEAVRNQTGGLNISTPVVILTANAGSENRDLYMRSGFDGYLVKPVSGEALEEMLVRYIPHEKLILKDHNKLMHEKMNATGSYSKKRPFVIATSTMCDLPDALLYDPHLPIIPFKIKTDGGVFDDCYQVDTEEMLHHLRRGRNAVSQAPDVSEYVEFFADNLKNAHQLIYIAITRSMSDDYERATEAAKSFENVTVINSECLSSAMGILVLIAIKLSRQDITKDELVAELDSVKKHLRCSFIIDSTEHMAKKGLISKRVSDLVTAMNLHPAIKFDDDRSSIAGMWIGSHRHAYRRYIKSVIRGDVPIDSEVLFITYADVPEETLLWIRSEVEKIHTFENVIFQKTSAAISSNCGSGSFGVLYKIKTDKTYGIGTLLPHEVGADDIPEIPVMEADVAPEEKGASEIKWYDELEGIDAELAIENSGSEESFATVLRLFYDAIDAKSEELNGLYDSEDWENYTIKIHALKSSAKLVGAVELSEEAFALEMAGKKGDIDYIRENHPVFMEHFSNYSEILGRLYKEPEKKRKPLADKFLLEAVYEALLEAAEAMDYDAIESALGELSDYAIPEEEAARFDAIRQKALNFEYEAVIEILKGE